MRPPKPRQLSLCVQGPDESTRDYLTRWGELRNSCEGVHEVQAIEYFTVGCREGTLLKHKLLCDEPAPPRHHATSRDFPTGRPPRRASSPSSSSTPTTTIPAYPREHTPILLSSSPAHVLEPVPRITHPRRGERFVPPCCRPTVRPPMRGRACCCSRLRPAHAGLPHLACERARCGRSRPSPTPRCTAMASRTRRRPPRCSLCAFCCS